jgi:hypothetical protein
MAKPRYQPIEADRGKVEAMVAYGIPQEEIGATLGISHPTLRRYFKREIQTGTQKANAKVAESLYNAATKGKGQPAVTAAIFWLKCRAGWKETTILAHQGKLEVETKPDLSMLTVDELKTLHDLMSKASGGVIDVEFTVADCVPTKPNGQELAVTKFQERQQPNLSSMKKEN